VLAILNKLDDNVEWETQSPVAGVPWLQSRRGKANIAAFFESLAPLKITRFEPHTFFESGDKIFVLIAFEAINREQDYYLFPTTVDGLWMIPPSRLFLETTRSSVNVTWT